MTQAQAEDTRVDWEAALVQRACTGDTRAFERLDREHAGRVYGLCLRMTRDAHLAEDCTQETFINAWRALAGFLTSRTLLSLLALCSDNWCIGVAPYATPVGRITHSRDGQGL